MTPFISRPEDLAIHASGWVQLAPGRWITKRPLWDRAHGCQARPGHGPGGAWLRERGMRLPEAAEYEELHQVALFIAPVTLPDAAMYAAGARPGDAAMVTREWCAIHDAEVARRLAAAGYDETQPIANDGKHLDAQGDIVGWWRFAAPRREKIQNESPAHRSESAFSDYATNVHGAFDGAEPPDGERAIAGATTTTLPTAVREGSRGPAVALWQTIVGATADGAFGPGTARLTRVWQAARGLVADGIVGAKSWAAAGYVLPVSALPTGSDPRAPACVAALRDANTRWPTRSRISDGIMGDTAHQARPSDHNVGNAVDITHDLAAGCDGNALADLAILDARTKYVIWNRRIYVTARASQGWQVYTGANGHTHHVHVSVHAAKRADASAWGWATAAS